MTFPRGGVRNPPAGHHFLEFWSDVTALITITNVSSQIALPSVTLVHNSNLGQAPVSNSGSPRVIAFFKVRSVEDTSGVLNRLTTVGGETPAVQLRQAPAGGYVDGINLQDDEWEVAANSRDGGDVLIGDIELSATVDVDGGYDFRLDDVRADGNNLLLRDVQTAIRLYWVE